MSPSKYGVIYADPPWRFKLRSEVNLTKSPQGQYPCMSLDDLARLPVRSLAADHCVLVMWATAPMLPDALWLMDQWDFTYKTAGAWAKRAPGGEKWAFGTGYIYRSAAEFWLLGTVGKPPSHSNSVRNLIDAPRTQHSRKPGVMRTMLEQQFLGPYLELFAREKVEGWDGWGNEYPGEGISLHSGGGGGGRDDGEGGRATVSRSAPAPDGAGDGARPLGGVGSQRYEPRAVGGTRV